MTTTILNRDLWQPFAGKLIRIPPENSYVYYFPQGHAENANCSGTFSAAITGLPPFLRCRVESVRFIADVTDEVFASITLLPRPHDVVAAAAAAVVAEAAEEIDIDGKTFAKVLTQSDANNGGGFSVPRNCACEVFPELNYSANPPVQELQARDLHGVVWSFRHIYRGTPLRHLLTSGWSVFVNQKSLVAKDSIVFFCSNTNEIFVGIRRARCSAAGRVRAEEVAEAARLAVLGEPFEVVYYPRDGSPEFCVDEAVVSAALAEELSSGMRVKMKVEDEMCFKTTTCSGSISDVKVFDAVRWPDSPWRTIQVLWDDNPDKQQIPKSVSQWTLEVVSGIPTYPSILPYAQPTRELRMDHLPEFGMPPPQPAILGIPLMDSSTSTAAADDDSLGHLHNTTTNNPAGIQGARHFVLEVPLLDLDINHHQLHPGVFPPNTLLNQRLSIVPNGGSSNSSKLSCHFAVEQTIPNTETSRGTKRNRFSLFGTVIEEPLDPSSNVNQDLNGKSLSDESLSVSNGSEANAVGDKFGISTGDCKVFKEFTDIGWTIDLSVVGSYDELYESLSNMFQIERSAMKKRVLYRDASGAPKLTGDEPFSDFMKKAKTLTIIADPDLKNDLSSSRTGQD